MLPPPRPAAHRSGAHASQSCERKKQSADSCQRWHRSEEGGQGGCALCSGLAKASGGRSIAPCTMFSLPGPSAASAHRARSRAGPAQGREGQGGRCAQSLHAWWQVLQSSGMLSGRAQCLSAPLPPRLASACWKHLLWTVQRIHASHSASSWQGAAVVGGCSLPASLLPALLGAGSIALSQQPEPGGDGPYRRASAKYWRCSRWRVGTGGVCAHAREGASYSA